MYSFVERDSPTLLPLVDIIIDIRVHQLVPLVLLLLCIGLSPIYFTLGLSCDIGSTSNLSSFELPTSRSEPLTSSPTPKAKRRRRPSSAESPLKYLQHLNSLRKKVSEFECLGIVQCTCTCQGYGTQVALPFALDFLA